MPDAFPGRHTAPIDAVPVITEDVPTIGFCSPLRLEDSREALPKLAATVVALPAMPAQNQPHALGSPTRVPDRPCDHAFVSQPDAGAVRTRSRPCVLRRDPNLAAVLVDLSNLVVGYPDKVLVADQNNLRKDVLSVTYPRVPPFLMKSPPAAFAPLPRVGRCTSSWSEGDFRARIRIRALSEWPTIRPLVPVNPAALLGGNSLILPL